MKIKDISKKIGKFLGRFFLTVSILASAFLVYFNVPVKEDGNGQAQLGVTFSSRYASDIQLDWKEAYLAMLDDLEIRKIRLPVYWDLVEKTSGEYDFADIDWQLQEAHKRNAEIILVVGQKVPRWPECAIPEWAQKDDSVRKAALLRFVDVVIKRYKNEVVIKYWQVENEPFLKFGICPPADAQLLDSEIALVRKNDPDRKIIITDSGELSLWIQAAKRADVFGTTMYRTIWKEGLGYFDYPIGPRFFWFKKWLIKSFARQNNAFVVELQAEPWISGWTTSAPLEEQFKSMNADKLADNVSFAKKSGFPEVYLWGVEWWYWVRVNQNHPELWEKARELFGQNVQAKDKSISRAEYPKIKNVFPNDGAKDVSLDIEDPITVDFDKSTKGFFMKFELNPDPGIVYQNNPDKTQFKLLPKEGLKAGVGYVLKINAKYEDDADNRYREIYSSRFETHPPPPKWEKDISLRLEQAKKYTQAKISAGKYIDISLSNQVMAIFENGTLLGAYLVSSGKKGMDTPRGSYKIENKTPRAWSKTYGLFMPYWMAIVPSGKFGIHELPEWPSGYKEGANHLGTPVSHGCVRLGVGSAKTVYEWAEAGTPVVIY